MDYCEEYLELISANLDGALSPDQLERLNTHLASCPGCQALYDDLTTLHTAMKALPPVEVPEGLTGRILDAVAAETQDAKVLPFAPVEKKNSSRHWQKWLATAAVLAVMVMGTWSWKPWESKAGSADLLPAAATEPLDQGLTPAAGAVPAAPKLASAPASAVPENAAAPGVVTGTTAAGNGAAPASIPEGAQESAATPAPTFIAVSQKTVPTGASPAEPTARSSSADGDAFLPLNSGDITVAPAYNGSEQGEVVYGGVTPSDVQAPEVTLYSIGIPIESAVPAETAPAEAPASQVPILRSAPTTKPQLYVPYDASGELGQSGAVSSQADAVTVLANYIYEFVGEVELVDDGTEVNYNINSPTGVSGAVTYVGEDEELFFLDYQDDLSPDDTFHYSVNKANSEVTFLGQESAPEEDAEAPTQP